MNKICNKIAAKLLANESKTHIFQPKTLNLYFKNSINPQVRTLNLTSALSIVFTIKENKEKQEFTLMSEIITDNCTKSIELASFRTLIEAENALEDVRVKLYTPKKTIFITMIGLMVFMVFVVMLNDFRLKVADIFNKNNNEAISSKALFPEQQNEQLNIDSSSQTNADINRLLQQLKDLQNSVQEGSNAQEQLQEELSPSDKLLKGLD